MQVFEERENQSTQGKSSQSREEDEQSNNHNKIEESCLCSLDYNELHSPIIPVIQNAIWCFIFRSIRPWNLIFWHIHLFLPTWVFPFWRSACQGILKWFYKRLVHLKYSNGNLRIISKKWIKIVRSTIDSFMSYWMTHKNHSLLQWLGSGSQRP